jgi:ABC-type lipoprotein release transport system permease subunit
VQVPLAYNVRNLMARKTTTLLTALGIALAVAVLLSVLALVNGLAESFQTSGHPLNLLLLRKGATAELTSVVSREAFQDLRAQAGIARGASGEPLASLELVSGISLGEGGGRTAMSFTIRGLLPVGLELRPEARIVEGRMFESGQAEVIVGRAVAQRYPQARLGRTLEFARGTWRVVGILDCGRAACSSEILGDLNRIGSGYGRMTGMSSALVRAADESALAALRNRLEADPRLNVQAKPEKEYYASQMVAAAPVQAMGTFVALLLAIGASFAAMNTMYAAVARRAQEIAMLRILGFTRGAILASFLLEALLVSLLGGAAGCLLVLPLDNYSSAIGNFVTFSQYVFQFRVSPWMIAAGMSFASLMGLAGGVFPAWSAARRDLLPALRA